MGQDTPARTSPEPAEERATFHRAPPAAPEGSRVAHLAAGALLIGGAVALWFRPPPIVDENTVLCAEVFLAFAGAVFAAQGIGALLRGFLRGRQARFRPAGRWAWEWPWDPQGAPDVLAVRARQRLAGVFLALAAMAPSAWFLREHEFLGDRRLVALLFAPAAVELLLAAMTAVAWKFRGRGRLMFHQFPYALGGTFEARYFPPPGILRMGPRMKATLRCVERLGNSPGGKIVARELWRWTEDVEVVGDTVEIVVEITAPEGLSTKMGGTGRFWELEVGPWAPGAAGNATFVVPVYIDPAWVPVSISPAPPPPAKKPATAAPKSPSRTPLPPGPRPKPSDPPGAASERLPEFAPVPVPRMEQPGALPTNTPTPFGITVEAIRSGERFRCELALTPSLPVEELRERVAKAFAVPLVPLPGAEAGTFFGKSDGLEVALQAGGEGRRLMLGGPRPLDAGAGEANEQASAWAIALLLQAGVAARRPD